MKIKTRGKQAFNVPNDPLGRMFLHLIKKYRNRGWYYRARGRGPREHHGNQYDIPQEHAEWLAVYLGHDRDWEYTPNIAPQEIHKPVFNRAPPVDLTNWIGSSGADLGNITFSTTDLLTIDSVKPEGRIATNPCAEMEIGTIDRPAHVATLEVAEWSAPIHAGSHIAADDHGKAYNADIHGHGPTQKLLGQAMEDPSGSIGEGEARVDVKLAVAEWTGVRNFFGVEDLENPLPRREAAPPEIDHGALAGLGNDNNTQYSLAEAAPPEEDTVELTQGEQEILERVLEYMDNVELQHWKPGDRLIFHSLFNKLVD